jgi:hypothetical protein
MKRPGNADFALGILLSVGLLFLANPLWAKCPKNLIEVHGKLQCTFKADYKVLITLIYSERQREASGEETALDIHDGSFKGEVAFSTFSSSNPFRGDICGRRPKSVLVRLIAADGTVWDRKELNIADAFRYDEEQRQYMVLSELTLHGWCEPKCAETPSTPCENPK